jgi:hypothetical protein
LEEELMPLDMQQQILVTIGKIDFPDYQDLKRQAQDLAEQIANVEVDEENVKQSKKLLAMVNKRCKEIDDRRIAIKKLMLEPYTNFEEQVKEILGIVKEADEIVRQQVRALEEEERATKHNLLEEIFSKRILHYGFNDLFGFADFLKPKHLNKTVSIDSVEKEMIDFLEKVDKDLAAMEPMGNRSEVLNFYLDTKDLAAAMTLANQAEQRRRQVEASKVIKEPEASKIAYLVSVRCENQKELKLLELLLNENGFEFSTDKII